NHPVARLVIATRIEVHTNGGRLVGGNRQGRRCRQGGKQGAGFGQHGIPPDEPATGAGCPGIISRSVPKPTRCDTTSCVLWNGAGVHRVYRCVRKRALGAQAGGASLPRPSRCQYILISVINWPSVSTNSAPLASSHSPVLRRRNTRRNSAEHQGPATITSPRVKRIS